jgi:hypothetical protein
MRAAILQLLVAAGLLWASACGPRPPDAQSQIRAAVQATLAAIPTPTPYPPPVLPTSAPPDLVGLFCEYQFCIGHPADVSFFDVSGQKNPSAASSYSQGLLAGYNAKLFLQLLWQDAPGVSDPQFMLDLILYGPVDTRNGSLEPQLIGDLNVFYQPIASTASTFLPAGGAAAWICGGRAFAWKSYTPDPDSARALLQEALRKFRCNAG